MRRELKIIWVILALLIILALVAVVWMHNAKADALPPDPPALVLAGDLRLSDAPMDLYMAACLRVDVVSMDVDGAWADLTLPYVPPSIAYVLLFDGWHLIHGAWEQTGEPTLRVRFRADELAALDGTVGVYLVILAEGGASDAAD